MSDEFAKGSVIVCPDCHRPVYALERGLGPMDRAGRSASAFRPVTQTDIDQLLLNRPDIPPLWQWNVACWWASPESYAVRHAERPAAGDEAVCPNCAGTWVRFVERDGQGALERGYEIHLMDIPPAPSNRSIFDRPRWASLDALRVEATERTH